MTVDACKIKMAISEANRERYGCGHEVEQYLVEPYHRRRLSISADIFYKLSNGKKFRSLLDIGGGAYSLDVFSDIASDIYILNQNEANYERHIKADVHDGLPFLDNSFDAVFAGEIIEHIFDTRQFLSEVKRILREDGCFVVTTPNLATLQDRLRLLFGYQPRHVDVLHPYRWLHIRQFTFLSLQKALESYSMFTEYRFSNYFIWDTERRRLHSRFLARLVPTLSGTVIVGGRVAK